MLQRGRHREKVSIAAALWWAPATARVLGLYYQTLRDNYFNNQRMAGFLERLMRELPGRMIVIWDNGNMHRGDPIRDAVERFTPRLTLERLPPYAPMLNPVEPLWSWLKHSRLANYAPADAAEANRRVGRELKTIAWDQDFLQSMWRASELSLPGALLL